MLKHLGISLFGYKRKNVEKVLNELTHNLSQLQGDVEYLTKEIKRLKSQ